MTEQELEQLKQIVADAPKDATHYHAGFEKYYRFSQCEPTAEMYLQGQWEQYPMYPSIQSLADIKTSIAQAEEMAELEKSILKENALVMANARRLIKAKSITSNAKLFMELFGTGFGTATRLVKILGLDPSGNKTSYTEMCEYLSKGESDAE